MSGDPHNPQSTYKLVVDADDRTVLSEYETGTDIMRLLPKGGRLPLAAGGAANRHDRRVQGGREVVYAANARVTVKGNAGYAAGCKTVVVKAAVG